jgi:hypothetical protein
LEVREVFPDFFVEGGGNLTKGLSVPADKSSTIFEAKKLSPPPNPLAGKGSDAALASKKASTVFVLTSFFGGAKPRFGVSLEDSFRKGFFSLPFSFFSRAVICHCFMLVSHVGTITIR